MADRQDSIRGVYQEAVKVVDAAAIDDAAKYLAKQSLFALCGFLMDVNSIAVSLEKIAAAQEAARDIIERG